MPGEAAESWDFAKWCWRTSLMVAVTVADHLGATHYLVSNLMTTATREQLPEDHPLRRFLKPFEYRANDVNLDAAIALSPEGGLAHRTFGFTHPGLVRCLLRGIETTTFTTLPRQLAARGVSELGERYPFATDGLALFDIMRRHAREYLAIYRSDDELIADAAVRAWWQALTDLAPSLGLRPLTRADQVLDVLGQFMFSVTGMHSQVGNVVGYLVDPLLMGGKLRSGSCESDVQTTVQLLNLAALTGLQTPPLLSDFTHLLLADHRPQALAEVRRFQSELRALAEAIDERNQHRPQPFEVFNPALLESSVSV
jgi:hypothetical protein